MSRARTPRPSAALWLLAASCLLLSALLWLVPRPAAGPTPAPPLERTTIAATPARSPEPAVPAEPAVSPEPALPPKPAAPSTPAPSPASAAVAAHAAAPRAGVRESHVVRGRVAIVIDDAGYDLDELAPYLELPGAVTIAVLPGLPHSAEAARRARSAGKPVLLHSPMQPVGGEDPGPLAILAGMGPERIRSELERQLDTVGEVEGINNHMGSLVTADPQAMRAVLSVASSRGLEFLDSRTTAASVAAREASALGMAALERDVFLDNDPDPVSMRLRLAEAASIASARGRAVAIGHVHTPGLAAVLAGALPELVRDGYLLAGVRELAREPVREGAASEGR